MQYELSSRYYVAEVSAWLLGATLLVSRFFGLASSQPLPLLNLTLATQQHFARIVAALLALVTLYVIFEWKLSDRRARRSYWAVGRISITVLFVLISLWLGYPLVAVDTRFEGISPAWYLGFFLIGLILGEAVSLLAFASLMIRTPHESRTLHLPRVPVATRAQYLAWAPISALLLIAYYLLFSLSPDVVQELAAFLVVVPFLFMIGRWHASLLLAHDSNGRRIPYTKRIARLKEIHDFHDYANLLTDHGEKQASDLGIDRNTEPKFIQETIRKISAVGSEAEAAKFTVQTLENFQFQFYAKDGNESNQTPENLGIRIRKKSGAGESLKVLVILENAEREPFEIEIQNALVEKHAEEYLSTNPDIANLRLNELASHAINQAVIQRIVEMGGPPLHGAVKAGDERQVTALLQQDINVNERAEYGWTPLLYAAAQGYPKIVKLLLHAGANPDIGNVHGVTPLMFGARYGNGDVCEALIEYGANTDCQDVYGMTALISATENGHADIVELLLRAGANRSIKDHDGMTALDHAYQRKHGEIAKYLRTK